MIVITGATGQLGHLVIAALLKKVPATKLVATVRNVEKAKEIAALGVQVRQADYNQPDSWDAALKGADKLLLISSSEIGKRAQQHSTVIGAAQRAGVNLLAYTSILHADNSVLGLAVEHRATEADIRASGLPFVLLRNGWYSENYAMGVPTALSLGTLYSCAGDGLISSAAREDYAEAAAIALTSDNQAGLVYELAGDTAYNLSEFSAEISRQSGKAINYVNLPAAEYKQSLLSAGRPEFVAELMTNSSIGASQGALFDDSKLLSKLLGRPTTAWEKAITAAL